MSTNELASASAELYEILEDEVSPAAALCLHKGAPLRQFAEIERRVAQPFDKRSYVGSGIFRIAGKEDHPSPPVYRRVLCQRRRWQVVEGLDQGRTAE